MKDRIPAPGKANRVRITQDNGQSVEGTLSYVDDAIQAGSRYTKQNVLPDDVCDALNIDRGGAEPKDAFGACWAVGDIKTTTRASLGANWHACDGSNFVAAELPELSASIGPSIQNGFAPLTPFDASYEPSGVQYVGGYYVVLGRKADNSGAGVIGYTSGLARPWAVTALPTIGGGGRVEWMDIIHDGAQYVALGRFISDHSSNHTAYIAYATQLSGPWSLIDTGCWGDGFSRLTYNDGKYMFAYREGSDLKPAIGCSSAVGSGWTRYITGSNGPTLYMATYFKGYYVAIGRDPESAGGGYCIYSQNMTDWKSVAVGAELDCLLAANGYLIAGDRGGKIWYATDPAGVWTGKQLLTSTIVGLSYAGKFVAIGIDGSGKMEAAEAPAPDGAWYRYTWSSDAADNVSVAKAAASNDGILALYAPDPGPTMKAYGYAAELRNYPKIDPAAPARAFIRTR